MINILDEQEEENNLEDVKISEDIGEEQEEASEEPGREEKEEPESGKEAAKSVKPSKEEKKVVSSGKKDKKKEKKKDPRDAKIEELNDKHIRLMAEFENFRKRTDKEKEMMFETGAKSVVEKILPVVDNFERALGMADSKAGEDTEKDPFMEGMEMVYRQLMTELEAIDVKPIEAVGKEFDPNLHNAVMQEESEELESGMVAKELQKGYTYRGSVVRHSMVSVVQ